MSPGHQPHCHLQKPPQSPAKTLNPPHKNLKERLKTDEILTSPIHVKSKHPQQPITPQKRLKLPTCYVFELSSPKLLPNPTTSSFPAPGIAFGCAASTAAATYFPKNLLTVGSGGRHFHKLLHHRGGRNLGVIVKV